MNKQSKTQLLPEKRLPEPRTYPKMKYEEALGLIKKECGKELSLQSHGDSRNKVFILPEAFQEFKNMVNYGRRSPMNFNEQKFNGLGHIVEDPDGGFILIVSHFIQIFTLNRSKTYASNLGPDGKPNAGLDFVHYYREEFLHREQDFNTDEYGYTVDPFLKICGASEYVLEGHTHPDIGVFLSERDKKTGEARAAKTPICNFVCDPIRKKIAGFIGRDFDSAEVILIDRMICNTPAQTSENPDIKPDVISENPDNKPEMSDIPYGEESRSESTLEHSDSDFEVLPPLDTSIPPSTGCMTTDSDTGSMPEQMWASSLPENPKLIDQIVSLAQLYLREKGHKGKIEYKSRFDGDLKIIIKLILPGRKY